MSCPQFVADSMAVRTAAHLAHLSSQSHAEHVALNDFYDGLLPLIDRYAEVYMGAYGRIASFPAAELPKGNPIAVLTAYSDKVDAEALEHVKDQALANILAELQALTSQTIYKLRYLK